MDKQIAREAGRLATAIASAREALIDSIPLKLEGWSGQIRWIGRREETKIEALKAEGYDGPIRETMELGSCRTLYCGARTQAPDGLGIGTIELAMGKTRIETASRMFRTCLGGTGWGELGQLIRLLARDGYREPTGYLKLQTTIELIGTGWDGQATATGRPTRYIENGRSF